MAKSVQQMFDNISPRYDLLNRFLSLRRDVAWRRKAARCAGDADRVLDLCGGTGDFLLSWQKQWGTSAEAVIGDFSFKMLQQAQQKSLKAPLVQCDALDLPFKDGSFELVLCGFGMRNFSGYHRALDELHRVLDESGRVVILDFFKPTHIGTKFFYGILAPIFIPFIGAFFSGRKEAYDYLVKSVRNFVSAAEFQHQALQHGFKKAKIKAMDGGIAHLVVLDKYEK